MSSPGHLFFAGKQVSISLAVKQHGSSGDEFFDLHMYFRPLCARLRGGELRLGLRGGDPTLLPACPFGWDV